MGVSTTASTDQRQIRVFLSSTFVDFMEERELLVKRVFPSLNRRARERGVEIVDVDLRWGVTQEQTEQGQTLPLCLAEIERCRPYFISLLGERYGWVPPSDYYSKKLLHEQPWLLECYGGASVTELEILHGVLRNPEMAGYARFYFRDPAYAQQKGNDDWLAQSTSDNQRLSSLKDRIRQSGFPVQENLPNPQAIAERVEADLWEVIDKLFPDPEQLDELAREERKHASYRKARLGVYLDAAGNIQKLDGLIRRGAQQILITGESGSGKSALVANWIAQHQQSHPEDQIYAHHLDSANDANSLLQLLTRLIHTISALLIDKALINSSLDIEDDWWKLVGQVSNALQIMGWLANRHGYRWIIVLDGLDRLRDEEQNAIAWLPRSIPDGVFVIATTLPCKIHDLLSERGFEVISTTPLKLAERELLIRQYLSRYTKELEKDLEQSILEHPESSSPLFLRVLLEELRQCASFDNLKSQLRFYLDVEDIEELYQKVLGRLENDVGVDIVMRVMRSLWASRSGLSETEILDICSVSRLQWTFIDLGFDKALRRIESRIAFGHDYLRSAVEKRYLPTLESKHQEHALLADSFAAGFGSNKRSSEELPWQLQKANRHQELRTLIITPKNLAQLVWDRGTREVLQYWKEARGMASRELDETISEELKREIENYGDNQDALVWLLDAIASILHDAGLYRNTLLQIRKLLVALNQSCDMENDEKGIRRINDLAYLCLLTCDHKQSLDLYHLVLDTGETALGADHYVILDAISEMSQLFQANGDYYRARDYAIRAYRSRKRHLGLNHPSTIWSLARIGEVLGAIDSYDQARVYFQRALDVSEQLLGPLSKTTLTIKSNFASLYSDMGDYKLAEQQLMEAWDGMSRLLGADHPETIVTANNLGCLFHRMGNFEKAERYFEYAIAKGDGIFDRLHLVFLHPVGNLGALLVDQGSYDRAEHYLLMAERGFDSLFGSGHPDSLTTKLRLGRLYEKTGRNMLAISIVEEVLSAREKIYGKDHSAVMVCISDLGRLYQAIYQYEKARVMLERDYNYQLRRFGLDHPDALAAAGNLASLYDDLGRYNDAESLWILALQGEQRLLGPEHPSTLTTQSNIGWHFYLKGDFAKAKTTSLGAFEVRRRRLGLEHADTLLTVANLGDICFAMNEHDEAESYYRQSLEGRQRVLGYCHVRTNLSRSNLAFVISRLGRVDESISLLDEHLCLCRNNLGDLDPQTLSAMHDLAIELRESSCIEKAEALYRELLAARQNVLDPQDPNIGRSLGGLALTLEKANKLDEALIYAQKALDHRLKYEGTDSWYTNRERLDLSRLLHKLGRSEEADQHLSELQASLTKKNHRGEDDNDLLQKAAELRQVIEASI